MILTWYCELALLHHGLYSLEDTGVSLSNVFGLHGGSGGQGKDVGKASRDAR